MILGPGFEKSPRFYARSVMTEEERAAIADFLAKKAPTKYPPADSGATFNLVGYIRRKGHDVKWHASATWQHVGYSVDGKRFTSRRFIDLVNKYRARDGLPPLGVRDGAT